MAFRLLEAILIQLLDMLMMPRMKLIGVKRGCRRHVNAHVTVNGFDWDLGSYFRDMCNQLH